MDFWPLRRPDEEVKGARAFLSLTMPPTDEMSRASSGGGLDFGDLRKLRVMPDTGKNFTCLKSAEPFAYSQSMRLSLVHPK